MIRLLLKLKLLLRLISNRRKSLRFCSRRRTCLELLEFVCVCFNCTVPHWTRMQQGRRIQVVFVPQVEVAPSSYKERRKSPGFCSRLLDELRGISKLSFWNNVARYLVRYYYRVNSSSRSFLEVQPHEMLWKRRYFGEFYFSLPTRCPVPQLTRVEFESRVNSRPRLCPSGSCCDLHIVVWCCFRSSWARAGFLTNLPVLCKSHHL